MGGKVTFCSIRRAAAAALTSDWYPVRIQLNGDPYEIPEPIALSELLARLEIDPRRVAVEHNLTVVRRAHFDQTIVKEGDEVEIVSFIGGGNRD